MLSTKIIAKGPIKDVTDDVNGITKSLFGKPLVNGYTRTKSDMDYSLIDIVVDIDPANNSRCIVDVRIDDNHRMAQHQMRSYVSLCRMIKHNFEM